MENRNFELNIRAAVPEDAARLLEIYSYYIEKTAVTFEWDALSVEEFRARIENISAEHPYFICEVKNLASGKTVIAGYAYAHSFSERKAYNWTVEPSIYVDRDFRGMGIGTRLYSALEEQLKREGIKVMIGKIAYVEKEDEYLTHASVKFHEKCGYRTVGRLEKVGLKFDRWYDIFMMQKNL